MKKKIYSQNRRDHLGSENPISIANVIRDHTISSLR